MVRFVALDDELAMVVARLANGIRQRIRLIQQRTFPRQQSKYRQGPVSRVHRQFETIGQHRLQHRLHSLVRRSSRSLGRNRGNDVEDIGAQPRRPTRDHFVVDSVGEADQLRYGHPAKLHAPTRDELVTRPGARLAWMHVHRVEDGLAEYGG
jgi:hypothetical protein